MNEQQRQLAFARRLQSYQPAGWNQIPDLGLYMDQVITYMDRQCRDLYTPGERVLTPAMVNNYVKLGLVKHPAAKKYSRESLAQLLMICTLKQAVSVEGIKLLLIPERGRIPRRYTVISATCKAIFFPIWQRSCLWPAA